MIAECRSARALIGVLACTFAAATPPFYTFAARQCMLQLSLRAQLSSLSSATPRVPSVTKLPHLAQVSRHRKQFATSSFKMGVQRIKVGSTSDFDGKDYGMQAFPFGDTEQKVLVTKVGKEYNAIASKCSHYGADLSSTYCPVCMVVPG